MLTTGRTVVGVVVLADPDGNIFCVVDAGSG
jgi:hypothetical protein